MGRFHRVIKNHTRRFMSFSNGFDLHSPSTANGDHYEHAKKEDPLGALPWAKTNIKISQWKMDTLHLAPPQKMKGKDSKPLFFFNWNDSEFFLAHYHSLIRSSRCKMRSSHSPLYMLVQLTKLQHVTVPLIIQNILHNQPGSPRSGTDVWLPGSMDLTLNLTI